MKRIPILIGLLLACCAPGIYAQGFTESDVVFYGEVRKTGGGQTVLLQSGQLAITFVNQSNPDNVVTLETQLRPTGEGESKPYSYALRVPLAYLPDAKRKTEFLSVGSLPTSFGIQVITIDGEPATLPDGSKEVYGLDFASRASDFRLDLLVAGDSADSDHDGLPDWWESAFGTDENLDDAEADPDDDGWSNLEEFRRGSDPARSNRDPQLVTGEIAIPESGVSGIYFHILDSDTPAADILIELSTAELSGFEVRLDGAPFDPESAGQLSLATFRSGRLTVAHTERLLSSSTLAVRWGDGGETFTANILLQSHTPSATDASESTLWLDGHDLPSAGTRVGSWPDRSGNARSAQQPLGDYQPVVTARAADFSTAANAHLFFQDGALPAGDHTILASYQTEGSPAAAQTILSSNRGFLRIAPSARAISYPGAAQYQMDATAIHGFEDSSGRQAISIFRREAALLQNIFGQSYDGAGITAEAIEPVLPTLGALRPAIPAGGDPVSEAFLGRLQELLVFPTALPEQKLRSVSDYLESKWGGAEIWDFSTEFKAVTLAVGSGDQPRIIRGGFADDLLSGGAGPDTLSGGTGDDMLAGGGGGDRFLFGEVDTGTDTITDFEIESDIIDLSALFWDVTGDARQHVSVRLDTNFETPVPTLDSALIVQLPSGGSREIVLQNTVVGAAQLAQLIVEGRLRMGALTVPASVLLTLESSTGDPLRESLHESFTVKLTRSGDSSPAALDVPVGIFEQALAGKFIVEGASASAGPRSVVSFARGETSKTVTVHPVPDLETSGLASVQLAVLPHYRYSIDGGAVEQLVSDDPMVWLEVVEENATVSPPQKAKVIIHRDGASDAPLVVALGVGGSESAIEAVPDSVTIAAGQQSLEIEIAARPEGLGIGAQVVVLQLAPAERYLVGNPDSVVLYAGDSGEEAAGAGFARWAATFTGGAVSSLAELAGLAKAKRTALLQAYAFDLEPDAQAGGRGLRFRIAAGRPEISVPGSLQRPDLEWTLQGSGTTAEWRDVGGDFVAAALGDDLRFTGPVISPSEPAQFYRFGFALDPGLSAGSALAALTGSSSYGVTGSGAWETDPDSGDLKSAGGSPGATQRIIVSTDEAVSLDFEMQIAGAGDSDLLVFYVDGVKHTETSGAAVAVQLELPASGNHLLMWEFTGDGNALIGDRR